jgi:hypothetical protein
MAVLCPRQLARSLDCSETTTTTPLHIRFKRSLRAFTLSNGAGAKRIEESNHSMKNCLLMTLTLISLTGCDSKPDEEMVSRSDVQEILDVVTNHGDKGPTRVAAWRTSQRPVFALPALAGSKNNLFTEQESRDFVDRCNTQVEKIIEGFESSASAVRENPETERNDVLIWFIVKWGPGPQDLFFQVSSSGDFSIRGTIVPPKDLVERALNRMKESGRTMIFHRDLFRLDLPQSDRIF